MEADDAIGAPGGRGDLGHRQRRGVRREDRARGEDLVERREELALRLELLDDRLDHDVAAGQVFQLGGESEATERGVALLGGHAALLDVAVEEALDLRVTSLRGRGRDLPPDRLEPCLEAELSDARPHRPQTHHADRLDLHAQIVDLPP